MRRTIMTKLTYRGVQYEPKAAFISYLNTQNLKIQRAEVEKEHDRQNNSGKELIV
jgi:hypothetical protein